MTAQIHHPPQPIAVSVRQCTARAGVQNQALTPVICAETAPVHGISAGLVHMPPGHQAAAHLHRGTELILYVLSGFMATLWGPEMEPMAHGPGTMVWLPPALEHAAVNLSGVHGVLFTETGTDPAFNDDVELLPELDELVTQHATALRAQYRDRVTAARLGFDVEW